MQASTVATSRLPTLQAPTQKSPAPPPNSNAAFSAATPGSFAGTLGRMKHPQTATPPATTEPVTGGEDHPTRDCGKTQQASTSATGSKTTLEERRFDGQTPTDPSMPRPETAATAPVNTTDNPDGTDGSAAAPSADEAKAHAAKDEDTVAWTAPLPQAAWPPALPPQNLSLQKAVAASAPGAESQAVQQAGTGLPVVSDDPAAAGAPAGTGLRFANGANGADAVDAAEAATGTKTGNIKGRRPTPAPIDVDPKANHATAQFSNARPDSLADGKPLGTEATAFSAVQALRARSDRADAGLLDDRSAAAFSAVTAGAAGPIADTAAPASGLPGRLNAPPGTPEFASQLANALSTFVRNGVQHARLELNPAEMGPLTLQIRLDGDRAQVMMAAEHSQTRQALEHAMPQLAGSLREAGLTLAGGGVFEQPPRQSPLPAEWGQRGDGTRDHRDGGPIDRRDGRNIGSGTGGSEPISLSPQAARRGVVDLVA